MVEFEQAVGRALATTEDPDYDVPDNKLYTGEQKVMIRPYPLPGSVKVSECFKGTKTHGCFASFRRRFLSRERLLTNVKDWIIVAIR